MNKIFQIIQIFLLLVSVSAPGQEALSAPSQEALIAPGQETFIAPGQETFIVLEEGFEAGSVQDVLRNWDDSQNAGRNVSFTRCA